MARALLERVRVLWEIGETIDGGTLLVAEDGGLDTLVKSLACEFQAKLSVQRDPDVVVTPQGRLDVKFGPNLTGDEFVVITAVEAA